MVTLGNKVYLYNQCELYSASLPLTDRTPWSELSRPPVYDSYLATYQSKLVLVGGSNVYSKYTNTIWASADGHNWHQSLPPMSRRCRWPVVLSSASPECLIVVGCNVAPEIEVDCYIIEVLFCGEWKSVQSPLAAHIDDTEVTIHNRSLCIYYKNLYKRSAVLYCCKLKSLLASCTENEIVWKAITPPPADYTHKLLLSFEQHLLAVQEKSAYVYSPDTESWALMDESNSSFRLARSAITFTDHILFKTPKYWCKATLKGALRNLKDTITCRCLI